MPCETTLLIHQIKVVEITLSADMRMWVLRRVERGLEGKGESGLEQY